jgi:SMC interacting uncharacterized protein involved in chromosome segregation
VWRDLGSDEYTDKYADHVDGCIAALARKRIEECRLIEEVTAYDRELRSLEWANTEFEALNFSTKYDRLIDRLAKETSERQKLTKETALLRAESKQLHQKLGEQANELQNIYESISTKKRGGIFGK